MVSGGIGYLASGAMLAEDESELEMLKKEILNICTITFTMQRA